MTDEESLTEVISITNDSESNETESYNEQPGGSNTNTSADRATSQSNTEETSLTSTSPNEAGSTEAISNTVANAVTGTETETEQESVEVVEIANPESDEPQTGSRDAPTTSSPSLEVQTNANEEVASFVNIVTPSPPKKRKRTVSGTPNVKSTKDDAVEGDNSKDDLDDGCTCPICFDSWEMSGEHRLVSLRCGHLFGESCIRRWLAECGRQSGVKMCPQCKTKAAPRDIRYLYAKRVRAIDRTEEHELRKCLEHDRKKLKCAEIELDTLKITYAVTLKKVQEQELEIKHLKAVLCSGPAGSSYSSDELHGSTLFSSKNYRFFLERNITLSQDSGCRVMAYTKKQSSLLVSQKSSNVLFPGFGVRIIDIPSFRVNQFIHLTSKMLRDISISADQQLMACTSLESSIKLYDFRMRTTALISAPNNDKKFWSCSIADSERENYLYSGGQQGSTFVFDARFPNTVLAEYETIGDLSPVISIAIIPKSNDFPNAGFCVCKLQSIWFYEYQGEGEGEVLPTRLNIEGPFMSMIYEESQSLLIITARITTPEAESRYLIGKLMKIHMKPFFEITETFIGSKSTPVMTRSCHISMNSSSLLASYIQDSKQLAVFDIKRKKRIQSLPVQDVVYDTCPIYTSQSVYLAALTENKCRIYKLNESGACS